MYLTTSLKLSRSKDVAALLGGELKYCLPYVSVSDRSGIVVGWGYRARAQHAKTLAKQKQLPYMQLEDGFISYLGHPALGDSRFSLSVDKTGIYYDGTKPSDLENLLNNKAWLNWDLLQRSRNLAGCYLSLSDQ